MRRLAGGEPLADYPIHPLQSSNRVPIVSHPAVFNFLHEANGPEWTAQTININIPLGVGTATVQMNSAQASQNPGSLCLKT